MWRPRTVALLMQLIREWGGPAKCGETERTGAADPTSPRSGRGYKSGGGGGGDCSRACSPIPFFFLPPCFESETPPPPRRAQQLLPLPVAADAPFLPCHTPPMARPKGSWEGSTVTAEDIEYLRDTRRLPPATEVAVRLPGDELAPHAEGTERVVFFSHFKRGFGLPASDFFG